MLWNCVGQTTNTLVVSLPPQGLTARITSEHHLTLNLTGSPNFPYVLLSATNLTLPISWQPVTTNVARSSGNWSMTISNLQTTSSAFYRATGL
jgi:hypothetical protein